MITFNIAAFKEWTKFKFIQPNKRLRFGTVPHINFMFYGLGKVSGRRLFKKHQYSCINVQQKFTFLNPFSNCDAFPSVQ